MSQNERSKRAFEAVRSAVYSAAWTDSNNKLEIYRAVMRALEPYLAADAVGAEDGWRPIETAPKDGTEFDAWLEWSDGGGERRANVKWSDGEISRHDGDFKPGWVDLYDYYGSEGRFEDNDCRLTFWRPLPPAPSPEGET